MSTDEVSFSIPTTALKSTAKVYFIIIFMSKAPRLAEANRKVTENKRLLWIFQAIICQGINKLVLMSYNNLIGIEEAVFQSKQV